MKKCEATSWVAKAIPDEIADVEFCCPYCGCDAGFSMYMGSEYVELIQAEDFELEVDCSECGKRVEVHCGPESHV